MAKGKRHFFPDEEPEEDYPWVPYEEWLDAVRGLCKFCGNKGHTQEKCPNRPLPKV